MKKFLTTLTAVLCCAMALSSCSKSDDNSGGGVTPAAPDTTPASIKFVYMAQVTADMLKYMDIEIQFKDESGNVKSEKITSAEIWSKEITAKLPAKMAARMQLKKKDGVEYDKIEEAVNCGADIAHGYTFLNKAGGQLDVLSATVKVVSLAVPGYNVEKYIVEKGTNHKSASWEYDANGKETTGKWLD